MKDGEQRLKEVANFVIENKNKLIKEYLRNIKILRKECFYYLDKGKNIRAVLSGLTAYEIDLSLKKITPFNGAIELIHLYSIIHDDLPSMDNALERRGKQSLHLTFGESTAVLTGDLLQNKAYHLLYKYYSKNKNLIDSFFSLTADRGLIAGQIYDIENRLKIPTLKKLIKIYKLKTGALFQLAVAGPAMIKNLKLEKIKLFQNIGCIFGITYQIKDDLEDRKDTLEPNIVKCVGLNKANEIFNKFKEKLFKLTANYYYLNRFSHLVFNNNAENN